MVVERLLSMLNRATALLNFADADAQFQRRYCSISPAEALNFNAVCKLGITLADVTDKTPDKVYTRFFPEKFQVVARE